MCSLGISTLFFPVQGRPLQNSVVMKKLCPSPQPSNKNKSAMWVLYAPGSPVKEESDGFALTELACGGGPGPRSLRSEQNKQVQLPGSSATELPGGALSQATLTFS